MQGEDLRSGPHRSVCMEDPRSGARGPELRRRSGVPSVDSWFDEITVADGTTIVRARFYDAFEFRLDTAGS